MRVQLEAQTQDQTLALPRVSEGLGWFDHEWSSSILPPGAVGWDWIGIHLLDGGSLMAFQLRSKMGESVWTEFDERDRDGRRKASGKGAPVRWEPVGQWRSPNSLAVYPGAWILHTAERRLEIRPLMPNQEFDGRFSTGIVYWEGAIELYDGPRLIGRGYLEMTGYAQAMQL
jgi:predicted secreted hydrolase